MEKSVLDLLIQRTNTLIQVPHCCQELKDAGKEWLEAIGTASEKEAALKYANELEEDVLPIDQVIPFFKSPAAAEHFGAERAKEMLKHMEEIKAAGAVYCDCAACAAGAAVLEMKDSLLS